MKNHYSFNTGLFFLFVGLFLPEMPSMAPTEFAFTCSIPLASFTEHRLDDNYPAATAVFAADVNGDGAQDILGSSLGQDELTWWENDGNQNFTPNPVTTALNGAVDVYAADVNSDGDMDVVGVSFYDDELAWYENDGSENFTEHIVDATFSGAYSVMALDMDGDLDIDLVGAATGAPGVRWYENDGNENFTLHQVSAGLSATYTVYATDLENDGDIDLFSAAAGSSRISWWQNDGNQNFTEMIIGAGFSGARSVYVADVDGDGHKDILGAGQSNHQIAWWQNDGSQNFTKIVIQSGFTGAWDVLATDLDNDGDTDVLGTASNASDLTWWENDGSENFSRRTIYATYQNARGLFASDIDADGDQDVLSTAFGGQDISWWENDLSCNCEADAGAITNNSSTPTSLEVPEGEDLYGGPDEVIFLVDYTGTTPPGTGFDLAFLLVDGSDGIVAYNTTGNFDFSSLSTGIYSLYTLSYHQSNIPNRVTSYLNQMIVGHGSADDIAQIEADDWSIGGGAFCLNLANVAAAGASTTVEVLDCVDGDAHLTYELIDANFAGAWGVHAADLNGDGHLDVLGTANGSDRVSWWENDGNQSFSHRLIRSGFNGARGLYVDDIDGDGDQDVMASAFYLGDFGLWVNDGTGMFTEIILNNSLSGASNIISVDLDKDNDKDILGAASGAGNIIWWRNDGGLSFTEITVEGSYAGAIDIVPADMDNDNDIDIVGVSFQGNSLDWWENDGSQNFTRHTINGSFTGGYNIDVSDFDGNGLLDIVAAQNTANSISWFENQGGGSFQEHTLVTNFTGASSVCAEDINNDGHMDVLATAFSQNSIRWWENDGSGNFFGHTISNNFNGASGCYAVDLDQNGAVDILGAASSAAQIAWWSNNLNCPCTDFPTTMINVMDETCPGEEDGSIEITASGGTPPYQFSLDGGATYISGANPYTFTGLLPATYDISVEDADGCASVTSIVTVNAGTSGTFSASAFMIMPPSCPESKLPSYNPDGSFSLELDGLDCCDGTSFDVLIIPVIASSPLGHTPHPAVPSSLSGISEGIYDFTNVSPGIYQVTVIADCPATPNIQTLTVLIPNGVDMVPPDALCQAISVPLSSPGITPADIDAGSTDNCGPVTLVSVNPSTFSCTDLTSNFNYALDFDGDNDYVEMDPGPLMGNVDFTVEVFARTFPPYDPGLADFQRIIGWSGTRLEIGLDNTTGSLAIYIGDGTMSGHEVVGPSIRDGNWHHFAFTMDNGSTALYLDNAIIPIWTGTNTINLGQFLRIGRWPGGSASSSEWKGQIDEIRVWDYARSAADLAANGATTFTGSESGMVGLWKFNDGPGSPVAQDQSPSGLDGVLENMDPATDWVPDGPMLPGGVPVTLTVEDAAGNTANCTTIVSVYDDVPSTITCPSDVVQGNDPGQCNAEINGITPFVSVNCPSPGGPNINYTLSGATTGSGLNDASGTVFNVGVTTVTYAVTDGNGSTSSCSFIVTVEDNEPPQVNCPGPTMITVDAGSSCQAAIPDLIGSVQFGDNCGLNNITLSQSPSPGSMVGPGTHLVTVTATDAAMNPYSCLYNVIVEEDVPPIAICQDVTVTLDASGMGSLTAAQVDDGSYDLCGPVTLSLDDYDFDCSDLPQPPGWVNIGSAGISAGTASYQSLAIAPDGTLYVAYQDNANGGRTTVLKWDGISWTALGGAGISAGSSGYQSMAIALDGTPYVAYRDYANGARTTVLKWNGTSWMALGGAGMSNSAGYQSLAIAPDGTPYVAYQDAANGNKTMVLKWSGVSWLPLGGTNISSAYTRYQSLAIAPDGTPYVAFSDGGIGSRTTVLRWNGSSWIALAGAGSSSGNDLYQSLAIAPDGTPYVAYRDGTNGARTTVMQWNGLSWTALGGVGISSGIANYQSLAIGPDGTPYVAYQDQDFGVGVHQTTVLQWDGVTWTALGGPGISSNVTAQHSLVVDSYGEPYVAYQDHVNNYKTVVLKYDSGVPFVTLTVTDGSGNTSTCAAAVEVVESVPVAFDCGNITADLDASGQAMIDETDLLYNFTGSCPPPGPLDIEFDQTSFSCADLENPDNFGLDFDGVDDYVEVASPPLSGSADYTIECWFRMPDAPPASDKTYYLFNTGIIANEVGVRIRYFASNNTSPVLTVINGGAQAGTAPFPYLFDSRWHHMAVTRSGNTTKFYLDGQLLITRNEIYALGQPLFFGTRSSLSSSKMEGKMDEFRIWDVALSQLQIENRMNNALSGMETNLLAYWNADEGTGSQIIDLVAGLPGSLNNMSSPWGDGAPVIYPVPVTITITDAIGNTYNCTPAVIVEDNIDPLANCQDLPITLEDDGMAAISPSQLDNGSTDNCGVASLTLDQTTLTCDDIGLTTVTLTVYDFSGNSSSCTATITVDEETPPVALCQDVTLELDATGQASLNPAQVDDGSFDLCGPVSLSLDMTSFDCSNLPQQPGWIAVGGTGISVGQAFYQSLAIAPNGTPYVAYQDYAFSNKTTVIRWDGVTWTALGGIGISMGASFYQSLAIAPNGTPYVAYADFANGLKTTVLQWNGTTWTALGGVGVSAGGSYFQSLAIAPNGTPYVAYIDFMNNEKTTVLRWNGASWTALGGEGISAGTANNQSLAIAPDGTPYVAYQDEVHGNRTTVLKWDGATWTALGGVGISAGAASYQSLAIAPDGTPYVAYQDEVNGQATTVLQWNGITWTALGGVGISAAIAYNQSLDIGPDGTPFVAYQDQSLGFGNESTTVLMWNGLTWTALGGVGFSPSPATGQSLEVDPNGTPFVTYSDGSSGYETSVLKYDPGLPSLTLTVTDGSGNTATCTAEVTVEDNLPPIPDTDPLPDITALCEVTLTPPTATDNCAGTVTATTSDPLTYSMAGTYSVTWEYDDGNGNISTQTQTVTVGGTGGSGPYAFCRDVTVMLDANGEGMVTAMQVDDGSYDDCGPISLSLDIEDFDCGDLGSAGDWLPLGATSAFVGLAEHQSLAIAPDGTPYLAIQDFSVGGKTTVLVWDGSSWTALGGAGISAGGAYAQSLAIASDGTPYVAYVDQANANKITVLSWNGSSWNTIGGSPGISAGIAGPPSLSIAPGGTVYIVYRDYANASKATVLAWDGLAWTPVGSPGISIGAVELPNIAISAGGTPYVAYQDVANGSKITVQTWDGLAWTALGGPGISAGQVYKPKLAIAPGGTPYVGYRDDANGSDMTVLAWDGITWTSLGGVGIAGSSIEDPNLAIAADGTLYVAYSDSDNGFISVVLSWNGMAWLTVGSSGIPGGPAFYQSLAIAPDGNPYIASYDFGMGDQTLVYYYPVGSTVVTLTVTSSSGQTASCSASVAVVDDLPPIPDVDPLPDIVMDCEAVLSPPTATDNCAGTLVATTSDPLTYSSSGTYLVNWEYDDGNGNIIMQPQTVIIDDDTSPTALCQDATVELGGTGQGILTTAQVDDGSFDLCGPVSLNLDITSFDCDDLPGMPEWVALGGTGISAGGAKYQSLAIALDGTPYVAYSDDAHGNRTTVLQWNGTSWPVVGSAGFSPDYADFQKLAIAPDGTLYVVYRDFANGEKTTVQKWDGIAWTVVGSAGISAGMATHQSLAVGPGGELYVAYTDVPNGYATTVQKWDGTTWTALGGVGVSAGFSYDQSLAIAPDGTPHIAYRDAVYGNRPTILKWDGTSWVGVGNPGLSFGQGYSVNLAIAPDGTLYVAYSNWANGAKAEVQTWDGMNWSILGGGAISASYSHFPNIAVGPDGFPYVAYADGAAALKTTVQRWDGISWTALGGLGISAGGASYQSMAISPDGTPYVAYQGGGSKTTVLKYDTGLPTVTLTVTDGAGNTSSCMALVTVEDNLPPKLDMITLPDLMEPCEVTSLPPPTATDNCAGSVTAVPVDPINYGTPGTYLIEWLYDDGNGNTAIQEQLLTIGGGGTLAALCADIVVPLDANGQASIVPDDVDDGSYDDCGPVTLSLNDDSFDCNDLASPVIVMLTVTNQAGQTATCPAEITVVDNLPPAPDTDPLPDMAAECELTLSPPMATDNCAGPVTATTSDPLTYTTPGTYLVTWEYDDGNGNITTQDQTVVITADATPPTALCQDATVELDAMGQGTLTTAQVDDGSFDFCGPVSLSLDMTAFDCDDLPGVPEWVALGGAGVSAGAAYSQSLSIAPDGTPYVAYRDYAHGYKTTVLRWDGSLWFALGGVGISAGSAGNPSLSIAPDGTPYVAYLDVANFNKTTVMRWDGSAWVALGGAGISAGGADNQSLCIAPDGTPYVAYRDYAHDYKTTVLRWDGSVWTALGGEGISPGAALSQSLSIAPDGTPYVAYVDFANGAKTTVLRWDGSVWTALGGVGISAGSAYDQSLSIAPDGTPYVAYLDEANGRKTTVLKYDAGLPVVTLTVTDGVGNTSSCEAQVTVEDVTGDCFLASGSDTDSWQELDHSVSAGQSTTLVPRQLGNSAGQVLSTADIGLYPNPTSGAFRLDLGAYVGEEATVVIYNSLGQLVEQRRLPEIGAASERFDLNRSAQGVYWVRIKVKGYEEVVKRVVKVE